MKLRCNLCGKCVNADYDKEGRVEVYYGFICNDCVETHKKEGLSFLDEGASNGL